MKLIYFSFKHRHRKKDLNNFLKSRIIGNFLLLNLGGPFKHYISKLLMILNIGKGISCDGRPIIKSLKKGINFWMRGTSYDIPNVYKYLNNNYVTIKNPIIQNQNKIFQIYPIDIQKTKINHFLKIVFVSKTISANYPDEKIWNKFKEQLINNFLLIDNKDFWIKNFPENDEKRNFQIYKNLKIFLRHEVVLKLKNRYKEKFILVGDDWINYLSTAEKSTFNIKYIKKLYRGNICLDLGSVLGSTSLYTRSNQIIESGGLIIQNQQNDYHKIWSNSLNEILFKDLKSLFKLIDKLLLDQNFCNSKLNDISLNFKDNKKKIEQELINIF
jgi:hypothetical protein